MTIPTHAQIVQSTAELSKTTPTQAENEIENDRVDTLVEVSQRMSNPKLSALRAQNPFLPIVPFPNSIINVMLPAGGSPLDIYLPEGTKYINIRATGEYFVSRNGNAQIPTSNISNDGRGCSFDSAHFVYVEELRSFSIISSVANNSVCISCYQQL
jgi:hypothetical protein